MSNQRLRIVLVGAGEYGRLYVEAMSQRDYGADLAAICDIDPHLVDCIPIRPELVEQVEQDGDCFYFVKNLEETLADCARHWALPSELGIKLG